MPAPATIWDRRRVSVLAGLLTLTLLALLGARSQSADAQQTGWGSFGAFRMTANSEPGHVILKEGESGIAVDPNDGTFFVAFKPREGNPERLLVKHFAYKEGAAKGTLETTETTEALKLKVPTEEKGEEGGTLGEGVQMAFDPARNRLYVLVRWERKEQDEYETKTKLVPRPAPEALTAGALYAFEYAEGKLVPLTEVKKEVPTPILDKAEFKAEEAENEKTSESAKQPLLFPLGLAVDPSTGNVAILGEQDESGRAEIEAGKEKCRAAVQWVKIEGTAPSVKAKLARRYVDSANVLGEHFDEGKTGLESEECGEGVEASQWQPYSPTFTPSGKLLAMTTSESGGEEGDIWSFPAPFEEAAGAKSMTLSSPIYAYPSVAKSEKLELGTAAGEADEATNPTMSLVADNANEGKLYVGAFYFPTVSDSAPSVLALHYTEGAGGPTVTEGELGWIGGYHLFQQHAETPAEIEEAACSLPSRGGGIPLGAVAVGGYKGGGREGVLAFKTGNNDELVSVDLGPGGSTAHCLKTGLESLTLTVNKTEKEPASVHTGVTAELESHVVAGVLSSVEWEFEYTTPQGAHGTEPTEVQAGLTLQHDLTDTLLKHPFKHAGHYTVTEKVHSFGNLAGPVEVKLTKAVTVVSNVKVQLAEIAAVPVGEAAASIEALVTVASGKAEALKYTWNFGDGTSETGETELNAGGQAHVNASHTFVSRCGGSCDVKLSVQTAAGEEGVAETTVAVTEGKSGGSPPPPPPPPPPPGNETQTTTTSPSPSGEVKGVHVLGNPEAKLASNSLSVTSAGAFTIKVTCPAGESSCTGTVTIKTASAVKAGKSKKKAILTLASGSFSVAGGQAKTITMHLSASARALLAHSHTLVGLATLLAHDSTGASRTVSSHVTLRLVAKHKH